MKINIYVVVVVVNFTGTTIIQCLPNNFWIVFAFSVLIPFASYATGLWVRGKTIE